MEPWYRIVTLRKEVREGRSFSPDEFAIALEQVVAATAPEDYRDPEQFFSRTCFTRALQEHTGMVLRRLSGKTENTAPVLTLITQFGGGKTHTLTSLYHLANAGAAASGFTGVADLLSAAGLTEAPAARVGVFVGNAWDPTPGGETPWIDLARQLAGEQGVAALGAAARTTPPGTEALARVFAAAQSPVLVLFDEVLNFVNRHRRMAESFHAFLQNLTVAVTGTSRAAVVVSLPRSQVEMTEWDQQWQERITKVVRRVARDLIANDESEISEVVRRRLFEDLGRTRVRKNVAKIYADWCFERSARLPSEWLAVDTATTESKAREFLRSRFEACYPFHPATLSVVQRKWRALPQFQQTRGALAMLAQWISWAAREQFQKARTEPLITLGSAPLDVPEFRAVVLGQLGESRLDVAIEADLAGPMAHARSLDVDAKGALRDIHRRVGTAILFESSGGQVDKVAHLPELRFAVGEPDVDTTTIDNAATALEGSGFFMRKVETWLAWQRVSRELTEGVLGEEYDRRERSEVHGQVRDAHEAAKDEVWASYRYLTLADTQERHGLKVIDLGAGHASAGETLCGRIISVLKAEALLNESVGAGYLDRNWPPALKEAGEWPLTSLRQSFLNGALTRLIDPDAVLRRQIVSFVSNGDFGFASGRREDGGFDRLWFAEPVAPEEAAFETNVFLLSKAEAEQLEAMPETPSELQPGPAPSPGPEPETGPGPRLRPDPEPTPPASETTLRLSGTVPSEVWNRIGIKLLPKLRSAKKLTTSVEILATVDARSAGNMVEDVRQILNDLGLADRVRVQEHGGER